MANPTTHGTVHLFGISGTITNATVESTDLTDAHLNRTENVDEDGNQIERRYDDLAESGTITVLIQSGYTIPTPGATLSWNNGQATNTFEITEVGKPQEAQGHRKVVLSVLRSANISYS